MKKLLIASLCGAFVLGTLAFTDMQPKLAGSGMLVNVQV